MHLTTLDQTQAVVPLPMDAANAGDTQQLLTFQLQDGVYGIDILHIREIRGLSPVAPLPGTPAYVKGIMNLRGAIIPVIDLRIRLGLPPAASASRFAVTIVTRVGGKNIGLVADAVNEVIDVPRAGLQKPPSVLEQGDSRFIQGLALRALSQRADSPDRNLAHADLQAQRQSAHKSSWSDYSYRSAAATPGSAFSQDQPGAPGQVHPEEMVVVLDLDRLYDPSLEAVFAAGGPSAGVSPGVTPGVNLTNAAPVAAAANPAVPGLPSSNAEASSLEALRRGIESHGGDSKGHINQNQTTLHPSGNTPA